MTDKPTDDKDKGKVIPLNKNAQETNELNARLELAMNLIYSVILEIK